MKRRALVLVFLALGIGEEFGQLNHVVQLSYSRLEKGYQCRIVTTRRVPFGNIWVPDERRLIVFVRQSQLALSDPPITPRSGPVERIWARNSRRDDQVVEVILQFRKIASYQIDYDGLDIVVNIRERKKSARKDRKTYMVSRERIERTGPLSDPQRITMDYREADLPNVLRLLARQNGVNIIAGPEITGKVTISLQNVTLREALDNILLANGYDYLIDGNVILVKPKDQFIPALSETKVYHLKYIDAYNLQKVIKETVSPDAKIQVLSPEFYGVYGTGGGGDQGGESGGTQAGVKRRSSTLVVTDRPDVIRKIDELVAQLDVPVPQILIESKLVELAPLKQSELGIDWDKTLTATLMYQDVLPTGDKRQYSVLKEGFSSGTSWKLGHLTADQFSAVLNFLQEHTESKLISNPRILAMDNQMSTISVGTTFPVPQINRGLAGQGDIVTFTYKDVNIQLNVTPHVVNDNEIIMYVNPVIEEITGEVVIDINRAPITSKRTVNTVVKVKDGETIVIGGMIKEDRKKIVKKVFLLGDIPLIGNFFRNTRYERKQTDLIIFITPHILRGNE